MSSFFFFFNDTATTEIYTLSLHDALPISAGCGCATAHRRSAVAGGEPSPRAPTRVRGSATSRRGGQPAPRRVSRPGVRPSAASPQQLHRERCHPVGGTGRSEPFTHQRESLTLAPRRAALAVEQRQYGGGQCLRRRGPLEEFGCHLAPRGQAGQSDRPAGQQPDRHGERYGVQAIRDDHRQVDERGFERGRARLAEPGVRRGEYGERIAHVYADGAGPTVTAPRRARYHHPRPRVPPPYLPRPGP